MLLQLAGKLLDLAAISQDFLAGKKLVQLHDPRLTLGNFALNLGGLTVRKFSFSPVPAAPSRDNTLSRPPPGPRLRGSHRHAGPRLARQSLPDKMQVRVVIPVDDAKPRLRRPVAHSRLHNQQLR